MTIQQLKSLYLRQKTAPLGGLVFGILSTLDFWPGGACFRFYYGRARHYVFPRGLGVAQANYHDRQAQLPHTSGSQFEPPQQTVAHFSTSLLFPLPPFSYFFGGGLLWAPRALLSKWASLRSTCELELALHMGLRSLLRAADRCTWNGWKQLPCNYLPTREEEDIHICMFDFPYLLATLPPGTCPAEPARTCE
jgi:hypothetical protein